MARFTRGALTLGGVLLAGTMLWAHAAGAAERPNVGKRLYRQYCASCHGEDGKGDGPVAATLTTKPTDLTQLAKKAGGKFPVAPTMAAIDGTTLVRPHGTGEMPVWGERLSRETAGVAGMHAAARGKLMQITDYLKSIQEK